MKFELLGKEIEISEAHKNYIETISYFEELADKAVQMFNVDTVNGFLDKYGDKGLDNIIKAFTLEARDFLAQKGAYTVSENQIWKEIVADSEHQYEHSMVHIDFYKVEEELRYEANNLDLDSSDYTKFMFAGIVKKIKEGYYDIPIRIDIMSMCDFCIDYLCKNEIIPMAIVSQASADEAKSIYKNLKRGNIPEEKIKDVVYEMITKDHAEFDYYQIAFDIVADSRCEIYRIATYLGFDLFDSVQQVLEKDFDLKSITSEKEALQMLENLQVEMQKYGIEFCKTKSQLEKIIHKYDVQARTYEDVIYDTREECEQAKKDDIVLNELCGELKLLDKNACKEKLLYIQDMEVTFDIKKKHKNRLLERIRNIDVECLQKMVSDIKLFDKNMCVSLRESISQYDTTEDIKIPFISQIDKRIAEIDKDVLQNLLVNLETFNELECNITKENIKNYDSTNEIKAPFISKIDERLYKIWDAEDFEVFTDIYFETQPSDFLKIQENAEKIKKEGRTASKELFYNALYALIIPSVEDAAKYAVAKEGGTFSSLINIGKKSTYETLTLNGRIMHPALLKAIEEVKSKKNNSIFSGFGFKKNRIANCENEDGIKFCSNCGNKMTVDSKFCSKCGKEM